MNYTINGIIQYFGHIVPSDTTIRTQEYMDDNGWFTDQPEID